MNPVSRYAEIFLNVLIFSSTSYSMPSGPCSGDFLASEVMLKSPYIHFLRVSYAHTFSRLSIVLRVSTHMIKSMLPAIPMHRNPRYFISSL